MSKTATASIVEGAEWAQRVDLAACYRLVAAFGWDDLIFTHISARVPGPEHHFLINPYGMLFSEITASSLVKVDLEGRKVAASPYEINPAGFTIHSAIHATRKDALSVLHVHTVNGVAVSAQPEGVLPMSQHSIFVLSSLAYHDYEGVALELDEQSRLLRDLGEHEGMILRNHGLLTVGASIAEAFNSMFRLERACRVQVAALSCNTEIRVPPREIVEASWRLYQPGVRRRFGVLEWPALLRKLDRIDPSYRD